MKRPRLLLSVAGPSDWPRANLHLKKIFGVTLKLLHDKVRSGAGIFKSFAGKSKKTASLIGIGIHQAHLELGPRFINGDLRPCVQISS